MNPKSSGLINGTVYYLDFHTLFWFLWPASFLLFMIFVIHDEGLSFNRFAIPFGLIVGMPVAWGMTWILRKVYFDVITPEGIEGHSFWGTRSFIRWRDIQEVRTFQFARFKYLRLYAGGDRRVTWIGLFHQRTKDFCQEIQRHAPAESPLRKFVE
jgi:hypothetical protein